MWMQLWCLYLDRRFFIFFCMSSAVHTQALWWNINMRRLRMTTMISLHDVIDGQANMCPLHRIN